MKDFLVNFIKLFLSILIVLFIEEYFFKAFGLIGIHLEESLLVKVIIYVLEAILISIIYGKEISSAFSKYQSKLGSNFLYSVISYIVVFIAMMITNYIVKLIASNLNIAYSGLNFINIFDKSFDVNLIVDIIIRIIIVPFVKVSIFVLGINNLVKGRGGIVLSGLIYALYVGFLIGGSFGHVFIDVIDEFVLFVLLSYLYKKNSNIAFSIVTLILYELFSALVLSRLL